MKPPTDALHIKRMAMSLALLICRDHFACGGVNAFGTHTFEANTISAIMAKLEMAKIYLFQKGRNLTKDKR